MSDDLDFGSILAVCAHPDDESFGLGAVLSTLVERGAKVSVLCFTHGEASSLGAQVSDLATMRAVEFEAAAASLGVSAVRLCAFPDGQLSSVERISLSLEVQGFAKDHPVDCVVVFDDGGITGHPDHQAATDAAKAAAQQLQVPVLGWALPHTVADALNEEFGPGFVGRKPAEIDVELMVDRRRQTEAIACHASQSTDNPVLWRRLELLGSSEVLRWLIRPVNDR